MTYDAAKRITDLRLAVKRASALLGMYEHAHDPGYLDTARQLLAQADEPLRKPRIPNGQRDAEDIRRQKRDALRRYRSKKQAKRLEEIENGPDEYDDLAVGI